MTDKEFIRESHSLTPPDPKLDMVQRAGLGALGVGLALFVGAIFKGFEDSDLSTSGFWLMMALLFGGGLLYAYRTHMSKPAGIQNNGIMTSGVTARGAAGWLIGIVVTTLYCLYYWFPETLEGLTRFMDPLSHLIRGKEKGADVWFMYGAFYTIAVVIMGAKAIIKYRHSRYQVIRTCSIMFFQLIFAFLIPYWMEAFNKPYFAPNYFWPLDYKALMPEKVSSLYEIGALGKFMIGWGIIMFVLATPILTYFFGKRWYCSWVCGCGGLANTAGDSWRQNSDKSLKAWKVERYMIYSVLIFAVVMTLIVWLNHWQGWFAPVAGGVKKTYGFLIGAAFSGVIGVGFYPIMGTRVWCRFGCPQAAILGIIQKYFSRFRITTNGSQCISCGNCSTYCEMGIDVRWYAQRGQDIVRASCVGCGMCSAVCPRGVLNLENGPTKKRGGYQVDFLDKLKSKRDSE